ncbi:MAG: hypothetical protein IJM54_02370 [Thermoguttaceae bacterium]|nr:hypothetical protein [Thermoguttaceae bacterium]
MVPDLFDDRARFFGETRNRLERVDLDFFAVDVKRGERRFLPYLLEENLSAGRKILLDLDNFFSFFVFRVLIVLMLKA